MDYRLIRHLRAVAARYRSVRLWTVLGVVWFLAAVAGVLLLLGRDTSAASSLPALAPWGLAACAAGVALFLGVLAMLSYRDYHWVAQRVEARFPNLQQRLLTAIDQRPNQEVGRYGYLQRAVIEEALTHAWKHPWSRAVPGGRIAAAHAFHLASLCGLVVVLSLLAWSKPVQATPAEAIVEAPATGELKFAVEPGNAEIEKGTGILIVARFEDAAPGQVDLLVTAGKEPAQRRPMTRSLDDPLFGAHLTEVVEDLTYQVAFGQQQSQSYRITVFEYPQLIQADAHLEFPSYTDLPDKKVEDTRRVSAVEGSQLTWVCHLNKAVKSATLIDKDGEELPLKPYDDAPNAYAASLKLVESRRWKLHLVDDVGRSNKQTPELSVRVLPNRAPELKLQLARDARVSPIEEFPVEATVWDDFGLTRFGLSYTIGGDDPKDVELGSDVDAGQRAQASHLLEFEQLGAEPDQLLSYHFWAEDRDAEGNPRRTFSDMFFAEVRHFEEIFRQGEQPPQSQQQQQQQQQSGAAQKAEQLAELQKQIINATWNVIRRETRAEVGQTFSDDVELVRDSQHQAMELLEELAGEVAGRGSPQLITPIRQAMEDAVRDLDSAMREASTKPLRPALSSAQAAYQGLLRLRAREHEVVQSQQSSSSSSSSSSSQSANRFQQQLQQLELQNEQNRYETQQQAEQEQDSPAAQLRQTLSRLSDLARRQQDLNQRLKELQSALEAAENEKQREEIERQLKRLRDQQEELLRETDDLLDQMNQNEQEASSRETRQQLEENRDNVRRSAEALEQGDVSQALSAGTRAEREFEQLRDDFRQQTANQFSESVREMRQEARRMEQRQEEIGKQITQEAKPSEGLRDETGREELSEALKQQEQDLTDLLQRMEETVRDAESAEPLLAQKLYDAYRETSQRGVDRQLEAASEMLDRGFNQQASEVERKAQEGISRLRERVEEAAESVLGNETEALRRAVNELNQLAQQIDQEIQRSDPNQPGQQQPGQQQPGQQQPGQQQPGQQQPGQQQPGQQQPGQQQPGQQQPGQQQPGQQQPGQQQPGQQQPDSNNRDSSNQVSNNRDSNNRVSNNQVSSNRDSSNRVSSNQVSSNRVSSNRDSSNQVSSNRVSSNRVSSNQVSSNRVSSNRVSSNRVSSNRVSSNQVSSNQVSSNQVSSNQVSSNQVSSNQVSSNQVSSNQVSSNRVSSNRVSSNRVSSNRVSSNRVSSNRVSSNRVSSNRVSSNRDSSNRVSNVRALPREKEAAWNSGPTTAAARRRSPAATIDSGRSGCGTLKR